MYIIVIMLISNSSTLILLAKVSLLQKFLDNYKVTIPQQVLSESVLDKETFDSLLIQKEIKGGRIRVKKVQEGNIKQVLLQFRLDKGEAAAYVLFKKTVNKAILTDDAELIKLCKLDGIKFVCALAVVVIMFKKRIITTEEANEKIDKLKEYGRYSDEIYNYFRNEVQ